MIIPGKTGPRACMDCGTLIAGETPSVIATIMRTGDNRVMLIVFCLACSQKRHGSIRCVNIGRGDAVALWRILAEGGEVQHVAGH